MQEENAVVQIGSTPWALENFVTPDGEKVPVRLTSLGMQFTGEPTWEQTCAMLVAFKQLDTAAALNLSDLLTYGRRVFGGSQLELALEEMEFDIQTARKAVSLMDVPEALRNPNLTKEHYLAVCNLTYPEQAEWLSAAVKHKLSALSLKRSIDAGRVLSKEEIAEMSGSRSGICTYQGVLSGWDRWERKVGGKVAILSWEPDQRRQWLADMKQVAALIEEVEKSLAIEE
ncbi:MAG: hypothetical protein WCO60_19740 [Verrucomicrobiota bacterium]